MCERPIGEYSEAGLQFAIAVFEERTGLRSADFEERFAKGALDDDFYFNVWHQLLEELREMRAHLTQADEELVDRVRSIVPERVGV